jgi:glycosyltransferase involved in cell wall biosynthesis
MNILHLHTGLNLTCGISKTIFLIAKYPAEGCRHYVVALDGNAIEKFNNAGIDTCFIGVKNSTAEVVFFLDKFIRKNNIDIVHSHHRYFDFVSYLISFFCDIKRITSVQSLVKGKKIFSYKSPLLLAAGDSVKKHLMDYFGVKEKRVKVFNNFVDFSEGINSKPKDETKMNLGIDKDIFTVGYIGRFSVKEKGVDILVNAFEKFSKKYPFSKLVMIGGGEDTGKIKIPENVIISDAKENIFDYYNFFDCIVLPSRIDPFPLTALEAGMMKTPFIGSRVNGIPEIISDNRDGLLFESENTDMLVEKIEKYYLDRQFAESCTDNLFEKVKKKYECRNSLQKLKEIYSKL